MVLFLTKPGFMGPRIEGWKPFILIPSEPPAKFLLLTLCCAGLEPLGPEGGMLSPENTTMIS